MDWNKLVTDHWIEWILALIPVVAFACSYLLSKIKSVLGLFSINFKPSETKKTEDDYAEDLYWQARAEREYWEWERGHTYQAYWPVASETTISLGTDRTRTKLGELERFHPYREAERRVSTSTSENEKDPNFLQVPWMGRVLYNPPETMTVGASDDITVRISYRHTPALYKNIKGPGNPTVEPVRVSELMEVKLTGEGFDIQALSEGEQYVETHRDSFTEWLFSVTPIQHGQQMLRLRVSMRIPYEHRVEIKHLPVIDRTIKVEVNRAFTFMRFVQRHWKTISVSMCIPLVVALLGLVGDLLGE